MEVVIDSNILFRTLISQGNILKLIFDENLTIFAPLKLREEFLKHKQEILDRSKLSEEEFDKLYSVISERINFIEIEKYKEYLPEAKELLKQHEKDEDFIALCILKNTKLWTHEDRIFDIGYAISTKDISTALSKLKTRFEE